MAGATVGTAEHGGRAPAGTGWPVVVAAVGAVAALAGLVVFDRAAQAGYPAYSPAESVSLAVALSLAGGALIRFSGAREVGRLLLACGLLVDLNLVVMAAGGVYWSLSGTYDESFEDVAAVAGFLALSLLVALLPQVFPDGLMPGRTWRVTAVLTTAAGLALVLVVVLTGLLASPATNEQAYRWWSGWAVLAVVVGLGSLGVRWRRGDGLRRRQLLPAAVSGAALLVLVVASWAWSATGGLLSDGVVVTVWVVATLVPTSFAIARHRLFDIDVRPRRIVLFVVGVVGLALAFAAVCTVLLWSVTLVGVGSGLRWTVAALSAIAAVLGVAAIAYWAIGRLRRRLLGDPDAALPLLAKVGDEHDDPSASMTAVVAAALGSPAVTLTVAGAGETPADADATGAVAGSVVVPLLLHGEQLGELAVGPRSPGERYSASDRRLIGLLAHQAAVHLSLRRRDDEIVNARRAHLHALAAERSRIGRDLHDGLAPLLAGASLSAEALRRGMPAGSPDERDAARLAERLRTAAGETRRISHALQPAALDHGLAAAVQTHVESLADAEAPAFEVLVDVPALPSDVSAAAYLVVLEAVNNVLQHAAAQRVRLAVGVVDGALTVSVADDGAGLRQPYVSGLGIGSMRERVAGLGGTLAIGPGPAGGTLLTARIPLP